MTLGVDHLIFSVRKTKIMAHPSLSARLCEYAYYNLLYTELECHLLTQECKPFRDEFGDVLLAYEVAVSLALWS